MTQPVLLSVDEGVAEIRFNRPDRLNAIDVPLAEGFRDAVGSAVADPAVRAILFSGEGRAFMAGGDLAFLRNSPDRSVAALASMLPVHEALLALDRSGLPTVAALQGAVAGAGMSLALNVDLAVAADNARFNFAYVNIAACPDCGGSFGLARIVGLRKALEIALLSDTIDAQRALSLGLVNQVVPADDLRHAALTLAKRLAQRPPASVARTRALLRQAISTPLEAQLQAEADGFAALAATSDFAEALDAFFERRQPRFSGE